MTLRHIARASALTLVVALMMAACAKKPAATTSPKEPTVVAEKPEPVNLTLTAAPDVNPSASNRPSPIVVRIYQLTSDVKFNAAIFFDLYDDEKKALGPDDPILKSIEVILRPGESMPVQDFSLTTITKFIGVIAAYRDITNPSAQWKLVVPRPVPRNLTVSVTKLRLELVAK